MKKLLIFDAYGTLISTGTGSLDSTKWILSLQDKDIDPVLFYKKWKEIHRSNFYKANNTTFKNEWQIFEDDLKELYTIYGIDRPYNEDVKLMLKTQFNRKVFDDTINAINTLKEKYRVVIGSTADTYPLLKNMEDNNLKVHEVYTSEIIRKYKPDKEFYKYILEKEKVSANEAVFIGDTLLDDVLGPSKLGITTILLDRNNKYVDSELTCDYIINSLKEIIDLSL